MTSGAAVRSRKAQFVGKYQVDITSFEQLALSSLSVSQHYKLQAPYSSSGSAATGTRDSSGSELRDSTALSSPKPTEFEFESVPNESTKAAAVCGDAKLCLKSKIPQTTSGGCVVVIDEIGKMELFSQAFVGTVRSLFERRDDDVIVLATIPMARHKPHWLVEELRHRTDCLLFEVHMYMHGY